jgi:ABC-type sulfate/molybdate transport systems ATPase subunit
MQSLGILHIEHQLVGDSLASLISTGQRRRVSIAVELITAPTMLFLDEPTSGLDSTTAMSLMELLKKISETGVIIVCILHQPREQIFDTLDHVMLLAEGMQLYQGPPQEAVNYFSSHGYKMAQDSNPADFLLDIAAAKERSTHPHIGNGNTVQRLAQMWEQQHCIQQEATQHSKTSKGDTPACLSDLSELKRAAALRGASWLRQVQHCYVRAMKQQLRQPSSLLLEIAVGGVAGLLIGLGLYPNKGIHFQGVYLAPFEMLSSAVDYTTVPKIGEMIALAIALAAAAPGVSTFGDESTYNLAAPAYPRSIELG